MKLALRKSPPACIWMQAGVVKNKPCFKDFLCQDCRFDRAMSRVCRSSQRSKMTRNFVFWQEKLRTNPVSSRPCIHHMKGRIDFKSCPKSYHCIDCEFDQFFQDQFKVFAQVTPVVYDQIQGFALPAGYYLSSAHTWVKLEGNGMVSVGVDDFVCRLLGRFDRADLPLLGQEVRQNQAGFTLWRKDGRACFPCPVSGVVTGVNADAVKDPSLILSAPYTDGWLFTMLCQDLKQDLKALKLMDSASGFIATSAESLHRFLEEEAGLAAADGGDLVDDIAGSLPGISFSDLAARFIPKPKTP